MSTMLAHDLDLAPHDLTPTDPVMLDAQQQDGDRQELHKEEDEVDDSGDFSMSHHSSSHMCTNCGTTRTPLWRSGPRGAKTLCNACGVRWGKGKLVLDELGRGVSLPAPSAPRKAILRGNELTSDAVQAMGLGMNMPCNEVDALSDASTLSAQDVFSGLPVCGALNHKGQPCQRIGYCPWHDAHESSSNSLSMTSAESEHESSTLSSSSSASLAMALMNRKQLQSASVPLAERTRQHSNGTASPTNAKMARAQKETANGAAMLVQHNNTMAMVAMMKTAAKEQRMRLRKRAREEEEAANAVRVQIEKMLCEDWAENLGPLSAPLPTVPSATLPAMVPADAYESDNENESKHQHRYCVCCHTLHSQSMLTAHPKLLVKCAREGCGARFHSVCNQNRTMCSSCEPLPTSSASFKCGVKSCGRHVAASEQPMCDGHSCQMCGLSGHAIRNVHCVHCSFSVHAGCFPVYNASAAGAQALRLTPQRMVCHSCAVDIRMRHDASILLRLADVVAVEEKSADAAVSLS